MTGTESDPALAAAARIVEAALADAARRPVVRSFFDEATNTVSHIVHDPATRKGAIIDSVMDYDQAAGRATTRSADALADHVRAEGIEVEWVLETHVHADHLTAGPYLSGLLGGRTGIGADIVRVQQEFGDIFNEGPDFRRDGGQFDWLFADGDRFRIGELEAVALHVPGHTPACMAYVIGDAVFPGDTLFMPDYGTARCDFPGGDARTLYRSIRRLLSLPGEARLFLCHDYKAPPARTEFAWETTVEAQRAGNIHVRDGMDEDDFVAMRTVRDATLSMPRLILPSVQVNMNGGRLPEPEGNGVRYLKTPVNLL